MNVMPSACTSSTAAAYLAGGVLAPEAGELWHNARLQANRS